MAYSEALAERVRDVLAPRGDVGERKMFGGIAFMVAGHMACGVIGDDLMLRVGAEAYDTALGQPHTRPMDFTGRPLVGMIYVSPAGFRTDKQLAAWVNRAIAFVDLLPAPARKKAAPARKKAMPARKKAAPARKSTPAKAAGKRRTTGKSTPRPRPSKSKRTKA